MFEYRELPQDDKSQQNSLRTKKKALWDLIELKNKLFDVKRDIYLTDDSLTATDIELKEKELAVQIEKEEQELSDLAKFKDSPEYLDKIQKVIEVDLKRLESYEQELELAKLKKYPRLGRFLTGVAKGSMALLFGGSTVVTIVLVGTGLHFFILLGLAIGAGAYAVKAIRDIYKRNKEEKKLTLELQARSVEIEKLFDETGVFGQCKLNETFKLIDDGKVLPEQITLLYKKLVKVEESLQVVFPGCDQKKDIKENISKKILTLEEKYPFLKDKKANIKLEHLSDSLTKRLSLHMSQSVTNLDQSTISSDGGMKKAGSWLWTKTKQAGNRTLTFMGGAAAAASVGVGIAAIVFGVSNPVGWVLIGILGASALVGVIAVVTDYVATRRQERKIQELTERTKDFNKIKDGIVTDAEAINHIFTVAEKHSENLSNLEIKLKLEHAKEKQELEQQKKNQELELAKEKQELEQQKLELQKSELELKKKMEEFSKQQSSIGLVSATNQLMHEPNTNDTRSIESKNELAKNEDVGSSPVNKQK